MMLVFQKTMEALLNPFLLGLVLFFFTLCFLWREAINATALHFLSFVLLLFLAISTGWLPAYLTRCFESRYPAVTEPDQKVGWIVVLSGGQANVEKAEPYNRLTSASLKRVMEGVRLSLRLNQAKLLLSGGDYSQGTAEAETMKTLSMAQGIPESAIVLETASLNTETQMKAIKKIVGEAPFYLVTSAIHLPRAMLLCAKNGLNPIAAPTDFRYYWQDEHWQKYWIPNANNMVLFNVAWHEILGLAWLRLRGN